VTLELLSSAQVAERLGVSRRRVNALAAARSSAFPAPAVVAGGVRLWRAGDVERFAASWDRRPGRRWPARSSSS
jgi:predicted XRE-type DNA-binding protein